MYRIKDTDNRWELIFNRPLNDDKFFDTVPLYTHPVKDKPHPKCDEACMYLCQMRELTDEEIKQAKLESWQQCKDTTEVIDFELSYQDELFARAILRKAQEK